MTEQLTVDVEVVGGLAVTNTTPSNYLWDVLEAGKTQYVDRTFTFTSVPVSMAGLKYLRTANNDKGSTGSSFISFDVNKDVTVYVAHDDRFAAKPSWMSGWADTGENLISGGGTFSVFAKDFAAGRVVLGGNSPDGVAANSMYTVVVKEKGSGGGEVYTVTVDYVSTGKAYSLSTAEAGALYYIDRSYTIQSPGTPLDGQVLIRTANDDKNVAAGVHLKFTVSQSSTVYVGYDKRATTAPSWLNDGTWTLTGETVTVTDGGASPLRVYGKTVAGGQVSLGGNKAGGGSGAGSNYVVVVRPEGSGKAATMAEGPMPAGVWEHEGDTDGDGLRDDFEAGQYLDVLKVDTDGDGEVDEGELAADGRTMWEAQQDWLAPRGGGDGGGGDGCGATGMEAVLLMGLLGAIRAGVRRSS